MAATTLLIPPASQSPPLFAEGTLWHGATGSHIATLLAPMVGYLVGFVVESIVMASRVDGVTGLPNAVALAGRLAGRSAPADGSHIVLRIDVDSPRTNGAAPPASAAVRRFAVIVANALRSRDYVAHQGGGQFVVIMPATTVGEALGVADRIHCVLETRAAERRGEPIVASIGIAETRDHSTPLGELVHLAESALRRAKGKREHRTSIVQVPMGVLAIGSPNATRFPSWEAAFRAQRYRRRRP
jgi:diguanylate cyclase